MNKITLSVKKLDDRYWILLNELDDKFLFRAFKPGKWEKIHDPSNHGTFITWGKGSPKCSPKQLWDISKLNI